ncbi:MAG: FAD-dependent oxidoreductase [Rhodovibrio sp.]|nr:FAD-dependent oxidoreductase [Rhodovibrio sp.]
MALPSHAKYVVIGAGVHGLSTAWHLAEQLKATGKGDGSDVLVVDKAGIAAGASGIACGVVRNNYYQPAMRELMAHSVEVWESDPKAFSYHPVGYMQISPECMHEDVGVDLPAAAEDRLRQRLHRGRAGQPEVHGEPARRLAGPGHHQRPAREEGRLRQQHPLDLRPRRQGGGRGRAGS